LKQYTDLKRISLKFVYSFFSSELHTFIFVGILVA